MEWKDLTIAGYQKLCKEIDEDYPDDLERSIGLLSCLTNKPIHYYTDEIPVSELAKKLRTVDFVNKPIPKVKVRSLQKIGGKYYRFNLNMRTATAGEYIDLSTYVKEPEKINDNLHLILATLCHEVNWFGRKRVSEHSERAEHIKNYMTMPYASSLSGFFLRNYQRLTNGINASLESEMTKALRKLAKQVKTNL